MATLVDVGKGHIVNVDHIVSATNDGDYLRLTLGFLDHTGQLRATTLTGAEAANMRAYLAQHAVKAELIRNPTRPLGDPPFPR